MSASEFVIAYYLGLIVFIGNFVLVWSMARTKAETIAAEKRIIRLILSRRRRRK